MSAIIEPSTTSNNRIVLGKAIPLKMPFAIQIAPSTLCNFKCNYCIQSDPKNMKKRELMKWETFENICNQIREFDHKLKQFNIAGWGEPLINKQVPDMISYIKKSNITEQITLVTNGYLLTEKTSLDIINAGIDNVRISLQGVTNEKYKEISNVKIDFRNLVNQIKFLYENKKDINIYVKTADISLNENEKKLFYSIFEKISDRMYIETIRPIFEPDDGKHIDKWGKSHPPIIVCPQPFFMMHVAPDGGVIPCCGFHNPFTRPQNVMQKTLKQIWNSKEWKKFQIMLLEKNRNNQNEYPSCNNCTIPNVISLPEDNLDSYSKMLLNGDYYGNQ